MFEKGKLRYSLLLMLLSLFVVIACFKKPTEPSSDNPLDINNPSTAGDPFELDVTIANGGITLNWTAIALPNLKEYNIYRSLSENDGYTVIQSVPKTSTSFVDTTISNGHSYWYLITGVDEKNNETNRTNVSALNVKAGALLVINGGAEYAETREVSLTILAITATEMILSNNSDFSGATWEVYRTSKTWALEIGEGLKTVYLKVKYDSVESDIVQETIDPLPMNPIISISDTAQYALSRDVQLSLNANGINLQMKVSEDSTFSGVDWESYSANPNFQLSLGAGIKTVYAKIVNDFQVESSVVSDNTLPQPMNTSISIANESEYTSTRDVALSLSATGTNLQMKISEDSTFTGINWQSYSVNPNFQLSTGDGIKAVYAKFINDFEIEANQSDQIVLDTTPPIISISFSPDSGTTYETNFQFDLSSSSDNLTLSNELHVRFDWRNDGTFDAGWSQPAITNHQYSTGGGDVTINLELIDLAGWVSDTTITIFVNTRPSASFTATEDESDVKLFHFDASASSDYEDGTNLLYRWDMDGDGIFDTEFSSNTMIDYVYDHADKYNPILEVLDQNNLNSTINIELIVQPEELFKRILNQSNRFYMGNSIVETNDGGFVTIGTNDNVFRLIKTDAAGNQSWIQDFGETTSIGKSVEQTDDGGFILAGYTNSFGEGEDDIWLIKTDANGNQEWDTTYGGSLDDQAHSVQQTIDGGYILGGTTESFGAGNEDFFLVKTDENGNQQWLKTFGGSESDIGISVQHTSDGGYVLTGYTNSYGGGSDDSWLVKTDANGNQEWVKIFGSIYYDRTFSVKETSDNGFILAGYTKSTEQDDNDFWLIKTDASGNEQWQKTYGILDYTLKANSVRQTHDGGYIIVGFGNRYGPGSDDIWVVKTDIVGNMIWNKTIVGATSGSEYGKDILQSNDGSYIVVGAEQSFGVLLVKLK